MRATTACNVCIKLYALFYAMHFNISNFKSLSDPKLFRSVCSGVDISVWISHSMRVLRSSDVIQIILLMFNLYTERETIILCEFVISAGNKKTFEANENWLVLEKAQSNLIKKEKGGGVKYSSAISLKKFEMKSWRGSLLKPQLPLVIKTIQSDHKAYTRGRSWL